jgi:Ca-activated chloride channel family protein
MEFTDTAIEATKTDADPQSQRKAKRRPAPSRPGAPGGPAAAGTPSKPAPAIDWLATTRGGEPTSTTGDIRVSVAAGRHIAADGAVLFDSASAETGQLTFLSVAFADKAITADALDPELTLLLFVGDLAAPRARVKLIDVLRQGGRRPLNVRVAAGQPVRLTLADPSAAWKVGVPAMEIVLGKV